jgi:hypothetical protein
MDADGEAVLVVADGEHGKNLKCAGGNLQIKFAGAFVLPQPFGDVIVPVAEVVETSKLKMSAADGARLPGEARHLLGNPGCCRFEEVLWNMI